MSLFGALNTAVSGLGSQTVAFGDNVANSQTVGFKRVDTAFLDHLTTSSATVNEPGSVTAIPEYINTRQGTVTSSDNPLSLAISGQGFFSVSKGSTAANGATAFAPESQYTRAGDFQLNKSGYLVNSAGNYLNGWPVNAAGVADPTTLKPILVSQATFNPIPTSHVTLSANLPPAATTAAAVASTASSLVDVYDQQGASHQLTVSLAGTGPNTWAMTVTDENKATIGTAAVSFGADGTLTSLTANGATASAAGAPATLNLATNYPATGGGGNQTIALNLGAIGQTSGLTQFAGTAYTPRGISQDGVPPGAFSSLSTTSSGGIVANYDNGQSRTIAQVPITTFPAADQLQRQDGSAFSATLASGSPLTQAAGNNGAGAIATQSVEASNVDIATEFTKLIVAQRAYSANAKIVTTAEDLLQTTIDMKR